MIKSYIINCKTSALFSYFYNGYEYSQVIEGDLSFLVSQSPNEIVKASFLYAGHELNGAIKSSRSILKGRNKLPVALSAQQNIILIRCNSKKDGTMWLVQSHIYDIEPLPPNQTIVHLIGGHSLIIDVNTDRLQNRQNQATFLRTTLLERSKMEKNMIFLYEKEKSILLVKEEGQINFTEK
ncbi:competence protein ComK [Niallia sp. XMNu-256]|uniref:competence protein ComK n=1 Tax=Niallia sp. XMNu-256 TaxID=3082444 RepID=UPI0030CEE0CC